MIKVLCGNIGIALLTP
ncbi:DUF3265 domain-containing protein [Vibrio harveyi]